MPLHRDAQTAEGPQLPLSAEPVRCLQNADQHRGPDRTDQRDLAELFRGAMFPAFGQQISPYLLTQDVQRVELPF